MLDALHEYLRKCLDPRAFSSLALCKEGDVADAEVYLVLNDKCNAGNLEDKLWAAVTADAPAAAAALVLAHAIAIDADRVLELFWYLASAVVPKHAAYDMTMRVTSHIRLDQPHGVATVVPVADVLDSLDMCRAMRNQLVQTLYPMYDESEAWRTELLRGLALVQANTNRHRLNIHRVPSLMLLAARGATVTRDDDAFFVRPLGEVTRETKNWIQNHAGDPSTVVVFVRDRVSGIESRHSAMNRTHATLQDLENEVDDGVLEEFYEGNDIVLVCGGAGDVSHK